ncbi:MAG: Asp-tRNA(Asn)/Glu-tRNA(Gln) amidotransferase subunit GatB [Candidatus Omnitrophota bacterium]
MKYLTTIGLEVHLQLSTNTKAFCGCRNAFGSEPNTQVCPVCLGLPGSLPVLNREFLHYGIKVALAINCNVSEHMKFDRKNYFYPDLPKNYQISQFDMPLATGGYIEIEGKTKKIGITRVHMEEDAGKLIHDEGTPYSFVDYNRTGTPLLEIVSEPDMATPDEAREYLNNLKSVLEYLDVSDCNMQEGSLRCDANISLRPEGQIQLGTKVEIKNMNSFKGVKEGLEYEQKRQLKLLLSGKTIVQETRLWNAAKKVTEPMRTKEEAHDYRYFPEPDLLPFNIDSALVQKIRNSLPELPSTKRDRFVKEYSISEYDASVLSTDRSMAKYFEESVALYSNPKIIVNWLLADVLKYQNENGLSFSSVVENTSAKDFAGMLKLIDSGTISGKIAKSVLVEMLKSGKSPDEIVKEQGLTQISNQSEIENLAKEVISENEKVSNDYIAGKEKALGFLVGQLMKKTKGKANPGLANKVLIELLQKKRG